ncbi:Lrp/AsnC family transcriptional regulator [Erythrobacter crassostreae]|uniref:Lrp/AsnC family transcriptional regulator n=1 Tax=Erythrobacter crassostreae TaxID=2828328 RepID=A0A9X1F4B7_9SPHN|nr:Lrp/AsnC family transcriptional regulator [Erythrobacter crassostrea]MBV7259083.1 Lrp/AsnC family transcriptional regulator [Erythrobacter crassostrea]
MIENAQTPLDACDRRILAEIQHDLRRSPDEIAEAAGTSVSSYRRRLKRLRESGVIEREVALVRHGQLGIDIIVMVSLNEERGPEYDRLKRIYRRSPQITQCYSVTGDADLILHVHMPDMATFENWIETNIIEDQAVKRCTSHVVYSRVKFETAIEL